VRAARTKEGAPARLRHLAYTAGWKKMEPIWDIAIRHGHVHRMLPLLEIILADFERTSIAPTTSGRIVTQTVVDRPAASNAAI